LALEADRRSDRRIQYSGKSGSYYEQEQYTTSCRLNLTQHVQLTIQDESNDINQKKKSIHDLHSIRSRSTQATQSASISSSRAHTHYQKNKQVIFRHPQSSKEYPACHLKKPVLQNPSTNLSIQKNSSVLLDSGLKSNRVGANDLADLLAVLEQQESGHGADGLLLGDLGDLVDVDLVEAGVGVVVGEPVGSCVSGRLSCSPAVCDSFSLFRADLG
jgi:hypothetical protein